MPPPIRHQCPHSGDANACSHCILRQTGTGFTDDTTRTSFNIFIRNAALQVFNTPATGYQGVIAARPGLGNDVAGRQAETPQSASTSHGPFSNEPWYRSIADPVAANGHTTQSSDVRQGPVEGLRAGTTTLASDPGNRPRPHVDGSRRAAQSGTASREDTTNISRDTEGLVNGHSRHASETEDGEDSSEDESGEDEESDEQRR
ncbi:hypothetical protein B0A48_07364 [Cryoendolithus antarcticus]|uniref:Uncharacterized protein n=1 Tax=Cryoendolithus antarcticus TaxID=1507870 RepID=A0A1V8T8D5_9PEZI|nr:hypothetical protein B0A48_07364 [Cryoendolithus antarcticus]